MLLQEKYSDKMKSDISRDILRDVGKVLRKLGVGVQQSEFKSVPPYRFRMAQALPTKTGDAKADTGIVVATTRNGGVLVIAVHDKNNAYIKYDSENPDITNKQIEESIPTFVKRLKNVFIVERQDNVIDKHESREKARAVQSKDTKLSRKLASIKADRELNTAHARSIIKKINAVKGFHVSRVFAVRDNNDVVMPMMDITCDIKLNSIAGSPFSALRGKRPSNSYGDYKFISDVLINLATATFDTSHASWKQVHSSIGDMIEALQSFQQIIKIVKNDVKVEDLKEISYQDLRSLAK